MVIGLILVITIKIKRHYVRMIYAIGEYVLISKRVSFISGRELAFTFAICHRRSVCRLSVGLSVTLVRPTQPAEILGNFLHHTIAQGL